MHSVDALSRACRPVVQEQMLGLAVIAAAAHACEGQESEYY